VASQTVRAVAAECLRVERPVIATRGGRRGHPLALPGSVIPPLLAADSTSSLKDALAPVGVESVHLEVSDPGVLLDVDVPADLA
jgi:CTP:molybdopterin cytidylyltransferase MocA